MGRVVWIAGTCLVAVWAVRLVVQTTQDAAVEPVAVAEAAVQPSAQQLSPRSFGTAGSALATAAFGLSALQPETYNSQIVRDIIEASPLAYGEKDRLTAKLLAAEAGQAELPRVLADIRVSLAVE